MASDELIENYLTNHLHGQEKVAFEKEIENSLELREEVELQQQIIDGIRAARAKELKDMLRAVDVSTHQQSYAALKRFSLATVSVAITGLILYFTIKTWPPDKPVSTPSDEGNSPTIHQTIDSIQHISSEVTEVTPPPLANRQENANNKEGDHEPPKKKLTEPIPPMEDTAPLEEQDLSIEEPIQDEPEYVPLDVTDYQTLVKVELDTTNQQYTFHYKFGDKKLLLFGPFKIDSYNLVGLHKNDSVAYLNYKGKYYYLDKSISIISKLNEVQDSSLLKVLKEKEVDQ